MEHRKGDKYKCKGCDYVWNSRKEHSPPPRCPKCGSEEHKNLSAKERLQEDVRDERIRRTEELIALKDEHLGEEVDAEDFILDVRNYIKSRMYFRLGLVFASLVSVAVISSIFQLSLNLMEILIRVLWVIALLGYVFIHYNYLDATMPRTVGDLPFEQRYDLSRSDLPTEADSNNV